MIELRILSMIALAAAIVSFIFGIVLKLSGASIAAWLSPQAIWRFSMGCVIFSIAFTLFELRDSIIKKTE